MVSCRVTILYYVQYVRRNTESFEKSTPLDYRRALENLIDSFKELKDSFLEFYDQFHDDCLLTKLTRARVILKVHCNMIIIDY